MSYSEKMHNRLADNLSKFLSASEDNEYVVSDVDGVVAATTIPTLLWEELLQQLMDIGLDLISNCFMKRSPKEIAEASSLTSLQKWIIRRKVRKSDIAKNLRETAVETLVATLQQSTEDELIGLKSEIDSVSIDWSLF